MEGRRDPLEIWICGHPGPAQRGQKHAVERAYGREGRDCDGQAADHAQPDLGVVEVPARKGKHPAAQIVLVDTPGVHKPGSQLDRRMLQEVHDALETRDLVLVLVDATRRVKAIEGPTGPRPAEADRASTSELGERG